MQRLIRKHEILVIGVEAMELACPTCRDAFETGERVCPVCGNRHRVAVLEEERLLEEAETVSRESEMLGLNKLIDAIDSVVLQMAPGRMPDAVIELQGMTSLVDSHR